MVVYNLFYDDDGNIHGFSTRVSDAWKNFNHGEISLELKNEIANSDMSKYKVDVTSKEFKVYKITKQETIKDLFLNKLIPIRSKHDFGNEDLKIVIKSINNKPHIVVNVDTDKEKMFDIYITRKGDPNFLYQSFTCDTTKENIFEIDEIDYKLLFSGNISLYYYKIFNRAGFCIQ